MVDTTSYTGYVEVVKLPNLVEMFSYLHGSMPPSLRKQLENSAVQKKIDEIQAQVNDYRAQSIEKINAIKDAQNTEDQLKAIEDRINFITPRLGELIDYGKTLQPEAFTSDEQVFLQVSSIVPVVGKPYSQAIQSLMQYTKDRDYKTQVQDILVNVRGYQAELKQLTDWYVELTGQKGEQLKNAGSGVPKIGDIIKKYQWSILFVVVDLILVVFAIRLARKK